MEYFSKVVVNQKVELCHEFTIQLSQVTVLANEKGPAQYEHMAFQKNGAQPPRTHVIANVQ